MSDIEETNTVNDLPRIIFKLKWLTLKWRLNGAVVLKKRSNLPLSVVNRICLYPSVLLCWTIQMPLPYCVLQTLKAGIPRSLCVVFIPTPGSQHGESVRVVCHPIVELLHHYAILWSFWMALQILNDSRRSWCIYLITAWMEKTINIKRGQFEKLSVSQIFPAPRAVNSCGQNSGM